jgi:hypothetical protein
MNKTILSVFILTAFMYLFVSPVLMAQYSPPEEPLIYSFDLASTAQEEVIVVYGIPFPLDILEGIKFVFPIGALEEDIQLHFSLPEFVQIDEDLKKVLYFGDIVSAVSCKVSVNDEVISPYTFSVPIELSIPFDIDKLTDIGLSPYDLTMMFVTSEGEFELNGIDEVMVDMEMKTLTGKIAHFSDIAIVPKWHTVGVDEDDRPVGYSLDQRVPDPLKLSTTVRFSLPRAGIVELNIFNASGEKVRTLFSEYMTSGTHSIVWNGCDEQGNPLADGVYFSRLNTHNGTVYGRMMLVK